MEGEYGTGFKDIMPTTGRLIDDHVRAEINTIIHRTNYFVQSFKQQGGCGCRVPDQVPSGVQTEKGGCGCQSVKK
jgi:hypothetical protein